MKPIALLGTVVAGGVGLLAGSQTWISFMLDSEHTIETVTGHDVNAALSPIAIAMIASALALSIAGPVFRRVLGVLVMLLGIGFTALSIGVFIDPKASIAGRVTEITGLVGERALESVTWLETSPWTFVSVAAGGLAAVLGVIVLATAGKWKTGGRKYEAAASSQAGVTDRISDWESLSDGNDPTDVESDSEPTAGHDPGDEPETNRAAAG